MEEFLVSFNVSAHDVVNWTPPTDYLGGLPTKHNILNLILQFVSQDNVQELPIHNQDSPNQGSGDPRFMFVVYGSDLIVKVWFVCIVLVLDVLGFS